MPSSLSSPLWRRYVPLSHPQPVEESSAGGRYICGVTNSIYGQKKKWSDAVASLGSATVTGPLVDELKVRLSGKEKAFIRNVLSGVERDARGEAWVREQFRAFTDSFLLGLMLDEEQGRALTGYHAHQHFWRLAESPAFKAYCHNVQSASPSVRVKPANDGVNGGGGDARASGSKSSAIEYYALLVDGGDGISPTERAKLLFNLHSSLADLADIDALLDGGAVSTLSSAVYLQSDSPTVRKYAIGVLATLASAVRGIVAVLGGGLLPIFVERLSDPMPAVGTAAANCLRRCASLFVGAQALVAEGIIQPLTHLLLRPPSDELLLRTLLASTLLQVYRLLPDAPRVPDAPAQLATLLTTLPSACRELALLLVELLDVWHAPLNVDSNERLALLLAETPDVWAHLRRLADADKADKGTASTNTASLKHRANGFPQRGGGQLAEAGRSCASAPALSRMHADLATRQWLAVPLVLAGAVELLDSVARPALLEPTSHAATAPLALHVLAVLADTSCGLERILSLGLLPWLASARQLQTADAPAPLADAAGRLLSVASQHAAGAAALKPCAEQLRALEQHGPCRTAPAFAVVIREVLARVA